MSFNLTADDRVALMFGRAIISAERLADELAQARVKITDLDGQLTRIVSDDEPATAREDTAR